MKKIICIGCFSFLLPLFVHAQAVSESLIQVGKREMKGFVAASNSSQPDVSALIQQKLTAAGVSKHGKKKKFYTYKDILFPPVSPNRIDVYYRVQKKKHRSRIYFVVSKGYDNYVTAANDATTATAITDLLSHIDADIVHNKEVKEKEQEITDVNKKLEEQKASMQQAETEKKQKEQELQQIKNDKN